MNLPVVQHHTITELINRFDVFPALSKEEEYDLAVRLKEFNDVDAAHRLVTSNLRNVVRIAMDYAGYGLPLEDIVQEGTIGLMVAVRKFDPYKGYRLMTYAVWWIKAMIHDHILKFYSQVKIGTTKLQKRLFYGLNKLSAEVDVGDGNVNDRTKAISARLDADPQQVEEIITRLTYRDQSLDTPLAEDSESSFMDLLADSHSNPEDRVMEDEKATYMNERVQKALSVLSDREQNIARQRLMADNPQTLEDLGRQYNVSKERIRQIENNVKNKLRKALEGEMDAISQ